MQVVDEAAVARRLSALEAPDPRVVVSGNFATPQVLLSALETGLDRCRAFVLNPQAGWPRREGFVTETPFVGPGVRGDPRLDYLPMRLSLVPRLFATVRPPDAVLVQTSAPRGNKVSLGIEVNLLPAAIEAVRRRGGPVIAQVNPQMPYTYGDAELDLDDVDLAVEVDEPLPSPPEHPPDPAAEAIGELVAPLAEDGGTIQLGIGQIPDAAARRLAGHRELGVWSELVSDGIMCLDHAGALDVDREIVATFLFGSPEFYAWADGHPRLVLRRTEVVNDPARIGAHPSMLSVNTALQVDLHAQANASHVHGRIYSGFGGQPDFVIGALHSPGGHAVIALRSWHEKSATSCVVPHLVGPACSFQHSVVVSEQGSAALFGRSQVAQVRQLIDKVSDPRARDDLWAAADRMGLVRPAAHP